MLLQDVKLRRRGGGPLHRQLADVIRSRVESGTLAAGERLPPSRDLARSLGVNRGTVQKAYDALVADEVLWARVGQGTFVRDAADAGASPAGASGAVAGGAGADESASGASLRALTDFPFSFETPGVDDPAWEKITRWSAHPDIISLAGGVPDTRFFPLQPFRECLDQALDEEGGALLQYGASRGYPPFLDALVHSLDGRGLQVTRDRLLVVSGSQQGLDLIGRTLLAPGETVVVEEPTYSGALALFRILGARVLSVPVDGKGLDVERLARLLRRERPRLVYTIPTFHNPTGTTLSPERRVRLLQICAEAGVPLVEDDSDGELCFEGEAPPPLAASSPGVIYIGTYSKLFFPGLRLGWVAAAPGFIEQLAATKRVTDLHTPLLLQAAMARFAASIHRHRLMADVRARYRARRDALLEALATHMPDGVSWTRPLGGLSLMVDLPAHIDTQELLPRAVDEGVVFAPGHLFSSGSRRRHSLRLTYGNVDEDRIHEGIARLGRALEKEMAGASARSVDSAAAASPPPV